MASRVDKLAKAFGMKGEPVVADPLLRKFIALGKKGEKKKPKKEPVKEKKRLTEFEDIGEWMLTMMLVAMMHVYPDKSPEEAIEEGREWAKKLWQPAMKHLWGLQASRIKRLGIRAEASKIRREMYKLL